MFKNKIALEILRWSACAVILQSCNVNGSTPAAVIGDDSVTEDKMADNSVSSRTIRPQAVLTGHIAAGAITAALLDPNLTLPAVGGTFSGNVTVGGTLGVTGTSTFTGAMQDNGNFTVGANLFKVLVASGNTTVAGTFTVGSPGNATEVATILNGNTQLLATKAGLVPLTVSRTDSSNFNTGLPHVALTSVYTLPLATSSTDSFFGSHGEVDLNPGGAASANLIAGTQSRAVVITAAATATTAVGANSQLAFSAAGTMTHGYGFHTSVNWNTGGGAPAGAINDYRGIYIEDPENPSSGPAFAAPAVLTKAYGVFADGANTLNVFTGKMGIGSNADPTHALDVTGATNLGGTLNVTGAVTLGAGINAAALTLGDGTEALCWNGGGGAITHGDGTGCVNTSDRRLKDRIENIKDALAGILKLNGVTFFWKDTTKRGAGRHVGVIAQDVKAVFPDLVKTDSKGFLGVNYQGLISPLIESVKELYGKWSADHKRLDQADVKLSLLEKKIELENVALKAENKALKDRLDKIELALAATPVKTPAKKGRKLASQ